MADSNAQQPWWLYSILLLVALVFLFGAVVATKRGINQSKYPREYREKVGDGNW